MSGLYTSHNTQSPMQAPSGSTSYNRMGSPGDYMGGPVRGYVGNIGSVGSTPMSKMMGNKFDGYGGINVGGVKIDVGNLNIGTINMGSLYQRSSHGRVNPINFPGNTSNPLNSGRFMQNSYRH